MLKRNYQSESHGRSWLALAWASGTLPGVLILAALVTGIGGLYWAIYSARAADVEGAVTRTTTATFVGIRFEDAGKAGKRSYLQLRFAGTQHEAQIPDPDYDLRNVKRGGNVKVSYRVGKSGTVHIDRIDPAGPRSFAP